MTQNQKPLPCPFCGAELINVIYGSWAEHPQGDCVLSEFDFDMFDAYLWNTRTEIPHD